VAEVADRENRAAEPGGGFSQGLLHALYVQQIVIPLSERPIVVPREEGARERRGSERHATVALQLEDDFRCSGCGGIAYQKRILEDGICREAAIG
jgi:hypothetical protein